MDLNAGLLTLIGEQRVSLFEKDKHIENLVKINNDLAQELQDTKAYAAKIEESNRVMVSMLQARTVEKVDECQQTLVSP